MPEPDFDEKCRFPGFEKAAFALVSLALIAFLVWLTIRLFA